VHTHRNGTTTRKRLAAGTGAASTNQGGPSCGGYPSRHAVHWVAVQSVTRTIVNTTRIRPHRILVAVSAPSTTVRSDPVSRRALRGRPFRLPDRRSRSWHRDRPGLQVIEPQTTRPPTLRYFGPVPYVRCFSSVRPDRPRNRAASGVRRKRGGRPFLCRLAAAGRRPQW
jgi:hypothetical protein